MFGRDSFAEVSHGAAENVRKAAASPLERASNVQTHRKRDLSGSEKALARDILEVSATGRRPKSAEPCRTDLDTSIGKLLLWTPSIRRRLSRPTFFLEDSVYVWAIHPTQIRSASSQLVSQQKLRDPGVEDGRNPPGPLLMLRRRQARRCSHLASEAADRCGRAGRPAGQQEEACDAHGYFLIAPHTFENGIVVVSMESVARRR